MLYRKVSTTDINKSEGKGFIYKYLASLTVVYSRPTNNVGLLDRREGSTRDESARVILHPTTAFVTIIRPAAPSTNQLTKLYVHINYMLIPLVTITVLYYPRLPRYK